MIDWPNEDKLKIIKEFKPLEKPIFEGNEDGFYGVVWSLYFRICDAFKSFCTLFENKHYYDAFIIAGHTLETCAILSYIKDCPTDEERKQNYNKYLASVVMGRLKASLEMGDTLESPIAWENFCVLLKLFYPVGSCITKDRNNPKEKHEEAIKLINYRKGPNQEKIGLFNKYYSPIKTTEYIKEFRTNLPFDGQDGFDYFYSKYCSFKHSNVLTPGASFEHSADISCFDNVLNLILGVIAYLQISDFSAFKKPQP